MQRRRQTPVKGNFKDRRCLNKKKESGELGKERGRKIFTVNTSFKIVVEHDVPGKGRSREVGIQDEADRPVKAKRLAVSGSGRKTQRKRSKPIFSIQRL